MVTNDQSVSSKEAAAGSPGQAVRRWVRELAFQDWLVLAYLVGLNYAAATAVPGAQRDASLLRTFGLLAFLVVTLVLVRGHLLRGPLLAPLLYRFGIYGTVQASYFVMGGGLLPIVNTETLDLELYRLDLAIFGVEPAMAMDSWVNPWTTEWFAFFYFGYFFLLAVHVIPILMFSRRRQLVAEFTLGMLLVFCIGHTLYMVVPGYGPYRAMAGEFQNSFPSGMWLDLVMHTVASGGAQMDIFPSLHTGGPSLIALFSFRNRDQLPFRYTWPIVTFCTLNIILATMFLRWHYIIDVVAGFALACAASWVAAWLSRREARFRAERGLSSSWPDFRRAGGHLAGRLGSRSASPNTTQEAA